MQKAVEVNKQIDAVSDREMKTTGGKMKLWGIYRHVIDSKRAKIEGGFATYDDA